MQATVYYDSDCGFCTRSIAVVRACDWLRRLRYVPLQSEEAAAAGLREASTLSQMVFRVRERAWGGWRAVKQIWFRLPLFYLMLAGAALLSPWLLVAPALLLSPLGNPVGDAAYAWIARNRHRLPGATCSLENR